MKTCPYCKESVHDDAVACPHCQRNIGPGHNLEAVGTQLQQIGCGLTLLVTIPIIIVILMAGMC